MVAVLEPHITTDARAVLSRAVSQARRAVELKHLMLGYVMFDRLVDTFSGYQLLQAGVTEEAVRLHMGPRPRDPAVWGPTAFGVTFSEEAHGYVEAAVVRARQDYDSDDARFNSQHLLEVILRANNPQIIYLFSKVGADTDKLLEVIAPPPLPEREE